MNYLFIPSSFAASLQYTSDLLWSIPPQFHTYLYISRSLTPLALGFSWVLEVYHHWLHIHLPEEHLHPIKSFHEYEIHCSLLAATENLRNYNTRTIPEYNVNETIKTQVTQR